MLTNQRTGSAVIEPWNMREYAIFRVFAAKDDPKITAALQVLVDAGCLVVRQDPDVGDRQIEMSADVGPAIKDAFGRAGRACEERRRQELVDEIRDLPICDLEAIKRRR